jgi:hypothetical protein
MGTKSALENAATVRARVSAEKFQCGELNRQTNSVNSLVYCFRPCTPRSVEK